MIIIDNHTQVNTDSELKAISQGTLSDQDITWHLGSGSAYIYFTNAKEGNFSPDDQVGGLGCWIKDDGIVGITQAQYDSNIDNEIKIYDYCELEQTSSPPFNLNFRSGVNVSGSGRFEHSKVLKKGDHGDYQSKVYYSNVTVDTSSLQPILSNPILCRDFSYEYHHDKRWVKKTETIHWHKRNDTMHDETKTVVHYFEGQKYMNYMVEKRGEIIDFLKNWVEQSLGFNAFYNPSSSLYGKTFSELDSEGKTFLGEFEGSIASFIDGGSQEATGSFVYKLQHDTGSFAWLGDPVTPTIPGGDPTEKIYQFMVSESLFPMS